MYKDISFLEAKEMMDSGDVIILDVRSEEEYITGHIKGAILFPLDEIEDRINEIENKNAKIIVYCKSGRRSVCACEILVKAGFTNIYNLGGVVNWPYGIE